MFGLISLHQLAAARGDGLRPDLLELLLRQRAISGGLPNVTDIAQRRDPGMTQAGPHPVGRLEADEVGNVVAFGRPARAGRRERPATRSRRR